MATLLEYLFLLFVFWNLYLWFFSVFNRRELDFLLNNLALWLIFVLVIFPWTLISFPGIRFITFIDVIFLFAFVLFLFLLKLPIILWKMILALMIILSYTLLLSRINENSKFFVLQKVISFAMSFIFSINCCCLQKLLSVSS